jgi:hypothetical protein
MEDAADSVLLSICSPEPLFEVLLRSCEKSIHNRDSNRLVTANGIVSRVTPLHTAVRNCTRDEGGPFEVGNQVLISSHRKLLSSKAMYDWVRRRLSSHPLQSYTTALTFKAPVGNNLPRTCIHCTQPSHPVLEDLRKLVRSWTGWKWVDLAAPHDAMITHPDAVVGLLLRA